MSRVPILERIRSEVRYWVAPMRVRAFDLANEPDLRVALALTRPAECVVDCGAAVGLYSVNLARVVGPVGTVVAVEASPEMQRILRRTIRRSGLNNVETHCVAASNCTGLVTLQIPYDRDRENPYRASLEGEIASRHLQVPSKSLDDIVGCRTVTFVKVDVEGHEPAVIAGARRLLSDMPALQLEIHGDLAAPDHSCAEMLAELRNVGYRTFLRDGEILRLQQPGDVGLNYFFLTSGHIERLREAGQEVAN